MDINKKTMILNTIHTLSYRLETGGFKYLRDNCKWGLKKGKYGSNEVTIAELRELADALETYMSSDFILDDLQFYQE